MPRYRYAGTGPDGKTREGERPGVDPSALASELGAEGIEVVSIAEVEIPVGPAARDHSRREVAEMIEQLSSLTRSGLPLPSGLRAAAEELSSSSLRATFRDLATRVESGEPIDEALASGSARFPAHVRGLVLAGSRSGRLADMLGEYVRGANLGSEMRRKFWATVLYPLLTLAVVVILVVFICHLSVVAIENLMGEMPNWGRPGPGPSRSNGQIVFLSTTAGFIDQYWSSLLMTTLVAFASIWATIRIGLSPARRRRLACRVPVFGPVLRASSLAEFCQLLAMLIEAETPLPLALEMAGDGVSDPALAECCRRMGRSVAAGEPLSVAVRLWPDIPAGLGELFRWSEERRGLAGSLRLAGEMFEARTRSQAEFAGNFASTFLLLLILWWVGFAVASLYIPLLTAISWLSG